MGDAATSSAYVSKSGNRRERIVGRREAQPSTLIRPPAGVANSMVPRLFAAGS